MGNLEANFYQKAITIIQKIPKGKVTTYGTIASLSGSPRASRIVGGILSSVSEKEDLPWHRVVNRKGFISIKNPEYPKELQKALLEQEGIEVSGSFIVNLKKYGWWG